MWFLDIPCDDYYKEKQLEAVKRGAWWDFKYQSWCLADNHLQIHGSSTIYAPFFEVFSETRCWYCNCTTPVVTLGVYKADEDNKCNGMQLSHSKNVILCCKMKQLPDDLIRHFCRFSFFGRTATMSRGSYWGPICWKCKSVQGEYYLYRPGGAFNSESDADTMSEIRRVEIIEGFEGKRYVSASFAADDAFCRPE